MSELPFSGHSREHYSVMSHIAHDMKIGRFPERSSVEQYELETKQGLPAPDFWDAIRDDERLAGARRKLSFDEFRIIAKHVLDWERSRSPTPPTQDPAP